MSKKRVVKDFDKLPKEIQVAVRAEFPNGFAHKLITYSGPKGEKISALPYETEDIYYLIRMSVQEARNIHRGDDDDYEEGVGISNDINFGEMDLESINDDEEDDFGFSDSGGSDDEGGDEEDY